MLGGVLKQHQAVHWLLGTGDECVSCAMATGYSPDDPIFLMLHAFTAYLRALWASCNGYDEVDAAALGQDERVFLAECIDGYDECGAVQLDDAFDFGVLALSAWSLTSRLQLTPRKMWNFADWGVRYDHGSFLEKSRLTDSDGCDERRVADSRWFFNRRPQRAHRPKGKSGQAMAKDSQVALHTVHGAIVLVMAVCSLALYLNWNRVRRRKELDDGYDYSLLRYGSA